MSMTRKRMAEVDSMPDDAPATPEAEAGAGAETEESVPKPNTGTARLGLGLKAAVRVERTG